jgi:4-amino-4-deoxy-L-arabinose transferase-like glycosyltransferase
VCYRWAFVLFGRGAAIVALIQWAFAPEILAYGSLITSDAAAAALGLLAGYTFWSWMRSPTLDRACVAGLCLGIGLLTKFTFFVFFPMWIVAAFCLCFVRIVHASSFTRGLALVAGHFGLIFVISLLVINTGYLFEGSFRPIGSYAFESKSFNECQARLGAGSSPLSALLRDLPVPLPEAAVAGMDLQKSDFEAEQFGYLWGQWKKGGWWYYYLAGFAGKLPIGWMVAFALSFASFLFTARFSKGFAKDALFLLFPLVAVLLICSSQKNMSRHLRYALPALPFAFVWTSQLASALGTAPRSVLVIKAIGIAALGWSVVASIVHAPHWLAYQNELVEGGPRGTNCVLESNLAWGQDLLYLKQWYDANPSARPLYTALDGIDPRLLDIDATSAPMLPMSVQNLSQNGGVPHGWYAVDVNYLNGAELEYTCNWVSAPRGDGAVAPREGYAYLYGLRPVCRVGATIYMFQVADQKNSPASGGNE